MNETTRGKDCHASPPVLRASVVEFLEEHRRLRRAVAELRELWDQVTQLGNGPQYAEMARGVRKLRDLLSRHFTEEERDGYLQPALDIAPHFTQQVEALLAEHAGFLAQLDSFIGRLIECRFDNWSEVGRLLDDFLRALRQHEAAENHVMQSAFNDDFGDGE